MISLDVLIEVLGRTLLHFAWQGVVLGLCALVALSLLRRHGPRARYGTACLVLVAMLAAPLITLALLWPRSGPTYGYASITERSTAAADDLVVAAGILDPPVDAGPPTDFVATVDALVVAAAPADDWLTWLVALWLCGVAALGLRTLGGWLGLLRLRYAGLTPLPSPWRDRLDVLRDRLGIARALRAVESRLVTVPSTIGWWRPLVLVPCSALARLTPEQLEVVLAHELAHIRRHDYLVNLLQSAVETLLFYHPAVWWLSRRIREERELCCDDVAAGYCGDPIRYARALTELEASRAPALALAAGGGDLLYRVRRLAGLPARHRALSASWSAIAACAFSVCLVLAEKGLLSDEAESREPPVVAVSTDGKLVQVPPGVRVVLRDAAGRRVRDGGVLFVLTPDQRLTIDGEEVGPGTHVPPERTLIVHDSDGRPLWTFRRRALRGERPVVLLSQCSTAPSSPTAPRTRDRKP